MRGLTRVKLAARVRRYGRVIPNQLMWMQALPCRTVSLSGPTVFLGVVSEPFEHNPAARRAGLDLGVHHAKGRGVDHAGDFGSGGLDPACIDQYGHLVWEPALLRHVCIFRFDDEGRIVEHWDVLQTLPESSKNDNTMF